MNDTPGPKFVVGWMPIALAIIGLLIIAIVLQSQMSLFHKTDFSRAFALSLPVWILAGFAILIRTATGSEAKTWLTCLAMLGLLLLMTLCSFAPTAG